MYTARFLNYVKPFFNIIHERVELFFTEFQVMSRSVPDKGKIELLRNVN